MSSSPNIPELTPPEKELQELQLNIAKRNKRVQEVLLPVLLEKQGLDPEFSKSGELIGVTEATSEVRDLREEAEIGLLKRQKQALAGELPISDILNIDLERREELAKEAYRKARPGTEAEFPLSRPGLDFFRERSGIIEAASRGDLTLAEQLSQSRGLGQEQIAANRHASLLGITGPSLALSGTLNAPLNRFQGERRMELEAETAASQARSQMIGSIFSGLGAAAGGAFGLGGIWGKPFP